MADSIRKVGYLAGATRFRRIGEKLQSDGDKIYSALNIDFKASWFATYHTLLEAGKPLTMQDIAASIGFTHITVKNIVRELEDHDIVKIKPNPLDARSKHVTLTTKGTDLFAKLNPVWQSISKTLEQLLTSGHPDFINIINRIEKEIERKPLSERIKDIESYSPVSIVDYKPLFKKYFFELAGNWLQDVLNGKLEKEDEFSLKNPDKAYLDEGGFVFFAVNKNKVAGCVALKRLSENKFEFCKLYINPELRRAGIATKLIERCISRCKENNAAELWLQTTNAMQEAHRLYYKLGFAESKAPKEMHVLKRTQKIMQLKLFNTNNHG
ncbi:MAG TPA: bifunctional helix-turn-helix transcriptional regulator/GNAT family N-acetyltransferase [Bacteroidia bacterium]|jgi:DNA-binding MarR family transcriptional regulator/N-acetylglutamate synthase-like GNAT family acetyltransferase|nr:bifunctional helix-turn-helix transcriptional regulator/GNAT family N-acetyltransferase [Bacteroidia bacterium]